MKPMRLRHLTPFAHENNERMKSVRIETRSSNLVFPYVPVFLDICIPDLA